ncbi:MAG TPA: hypothetical protein VLF94_00995 [Chlamydiales bacterium]|nr:hypothetical protein [Chlamydiales bacterium]
MSQPFIILIDRLKGGHSQKIEEALDPSFLGADEPDLRFTTKVTVKGEAYLTDAHLIVHLKARTVVSMPCSVCNQMIDTELKVENFYHTEPIEEIQGAKFNYSEALREAVLIELPRTVECNKGNCPERATITPYLRSEKRTDKTTYFPFADMDQLE